MTRIARTGAVIPSHIGAKSADDRGVLPNVVRGFIRKVVYPEDKENLTGHLEYVVVINGQDFHGCLDAVAMGGIHNNHIKVRKGQTVDVNPKSMAPFLTEDNKNGDAVWCMFVNNDDAHPLIVGSATHPRIDENSDYLKPSKALGEFERYEFNGLEFLINKDGDFILTQKGLKHPILGKAAPPQTGYFKVLKNGDFEVKTTLGTIIQVIDAGAKISLRSPINDKVEISSADGVQIEVPTGSKASFKNAKIDLESPSDISVKSITGKVTVEGATDVSIKGTAGTVAIEGSLAKLKLSGAKVGLGSEAGEVVELLEDSLMKIEALIDQIVLITVPTAVGTSGVPTNAAAITAIKTLITTTIKSKVTAIKGGI